MGFVGNAVFHLQNKAQGRTWDNFAEDGSYIFKNVDFLKPLTARIWCRERGRQTEKEDGERARQ